MGRIEKLNEFVEGSFKHFILGVIIFNAIIMGILTIKSMNDTVRSIFSFLDMACLFIFIFEMILKMVVTKFYGYFKCLWNVFDFIIIISSIFSEFNLLPSVRILRVFRVFRSMRAIRGFKLISSIHSLQVIIYAIGKSIPGISWTSFLLLIIYYIFSVIGVMEFGDVFPDWFGTIPRAMYTLFQVMTFESWSMGISRPVMEVYPYAWIYFVPYLLISAFITMNVVVGIVVNSISEVTEGEMEGESEEMKKKNYTETMKSEIDTIREHLSNLDEILKEGKVVNSNNVNNNNNCSIKVNQMDD